MSVYGQVVLEDEARAVAAAPEEKLTARLSRAALAIGRLVAAGEIDRAEAHATLVLAASGAGLRAAAIETTIARGFDVGRPERGTARAA